MKKIITLSCFVLGTMGISAQVGIGNPSPNSNSVLDLTNSSNLGLVLPTFTGIIPSAPPAGTVYADTTNNVLFFKESGGVYNGLSAWKYKYNGSTSADTYYDETGNVGIGTDLPFFKFTIKNNGASFALEGDDHTWMGFYPDGQAAGRKAYIGFGSAVDDRFTINSDFSGGEIYLQTNAGTVTTNCDIDVTGKVKENGNDLLPAGSIIMWHGATVPAGWALCNGANGTPNLINQFVKCSATPNTTGGSNTVTLSTANLPAHTHGAGSLATSTAGSHQHSFRYRTTALDHTNSGFEVLIDNAVQDGWNTASHTAAGDHTHTITGSTASQGSGTAFSVEPSYYSLMYIMKL